MLVQEFEGKNEQEAIKSALETLNLKAEQIKVETITDHKKVGFFGFRNRKPIKIKVYYEENKKKDFSEKVKNYFEDLFQLMKIEVEISIIAEEAKKLYISIFSQESGLLIGKQGKTLESLQLLANTWVKKSQNKATEKKIILDIEGYLNRRKEFIQKLSLKTAKEVQETHDPKTLFPMNPFERRLVHMTVKKIEGVGTKSEGKARTAK